MANVLKFYGFEFSSAGHASPELSSAQSCFKGTLTITNLIFLIFGCILCGVGAYAMQTKAGALAGETLPTGVIVLGVFIMLISMLGCLAAYRESRCMLGVYFGFLLIFVIILMAIGIGVYAKKDSASIYMTEGWCAASTAIQADIQTYFQCCGLYWYNDSLARFDTETGIDVAAACSHITPDEKPRWLPCPSNIGKDVGQPCLPILQSTFESSYIAAGACAIAFAVIMGAGMIVVCVLMSGIKEKKHLEDIRKLHRKLREAKEDPAHAGLAGISPRDIDSGYGEVDTSAAASAAAGVAIGHEAGLDEGLDHEVHLHVREGEDALATADEESGYSTGPAPPAATSARSSRSPPAAAAAAAAPASGRGKAPRYQPEPSVEEESYEDEAEEEVVAPPPKSARAAAKAAAQAAAAAAAAAVSPIRGGKKKATAPPPPEDYEDEESTSQQPAGYAQGDYDDEDN